VSTIAFIGLGIMGDPMAQHLVDAATPSSASIAPPVRWNDSLRREASAQPALPKQSEMLT
jgi:3-hydroxyisobutyrate dehydrogenase-like beta-hydroxyacid dehydrogenase